MPDIWGKIAERDLFYKALKDPANKGLTLNKVMAKPKYATLLDGFDAYNKKLWRNFFNRWKDHISSSDKKGQSLTKKLHDARAELHLSSQQKSQIDDLKDGLETMVTIVTTIAKTVANDKTQQRADTGSLQTSLCDLQQKVEEIQRELGKK